MNIELKLKDKTSEHFVDYACTYIPSVGDQICTPKGDVVVLSVKYFQAMSVPYNLTKIRLVVAHV